MRQLSAVNPTSYILFNPPLRLEQAEERLKGMFLEMPRTKLTIAEAARLAGLDPSMSETVLNVLRGGGVPQTPRQWRIHAVLNIAEIHVAHASNGS